MPLHLNARDGGLLLIIELALLMRYACNISCSPSPPHSKQSIYLIELQKRLVFVLRCKMTSPGHKHLHKHCLQSKASTNSLHPTIGPAHWHSVAWRLDTLLCWIRVLHHDAIIKITIITIIKMTITAAILSTLDTVYKCAFAFWHTFMRF